jgi:hypothetical protein
MEPIGRREGDRRTACLAAAVRHLPRSLLGPASTLRVGTDKPDARNYRSPLGS